MKPKKLLPLLILALAAVGCDSNPTNAPSAEEVRQADAHREAAIDSDPSMTPDQKAAMKKALGMNSGAPKSR